MSTRFNWNIFPSTRLEASKLTTPVGCLYKPFDEENTPLVESAPIACSTCENYMNCYVRFDRTNNMWWCPFCENRSFLPDDFPLPPVNSPSHSWPVQVQPQSSTVDYVLPVDITSGTPITDVYVFVVDSYQVADEAEKSTSFNALRTNLVKRIQSLPSDSLVALFTFDQHVTVHHMDEKDTTIITLSDIFDMDAETNELRYNSKMSVFSSSVIYKVLAKFSTEAFVLPKHIESSPAQRYFSSPSTAADYIQTLVPKITHSFKPPRATGLAMLTATIFLNKMSFRSLNGNLCLFTSGPCTSFPGNIVETNQALRSHNDIVNFKSPQFLPAAKFYATLGLVASGCSLEVANSIVSSYGKKESDFTVSPLAPKWSVDIYTGSLDQVGVYEMRSMAALTAGRIYLFDSFGNLRFMNMPVEENPKSIHNTLTVKTSAKLKVIMMISHGRSLPSSYQSEKNYDLHHQKISDHMSEFDCNTKKKNFTNQWGFNRLQKEDTLSVFFEFDTEGSSDALAATGVQDAYIQFQLKYWSAERKRWILRTTTVCKNTTLYHYVNNPVKMSDKTTRIVNSKSKKIVEQQTIASFDQEAYIVLLTRLLLDKIDSTLGFEKFDNIIADVDAIVNRLMKNFGGIMRNESYGTQSNPYTNVLSSIMDRFKTKQQFARIPSLAYNLRRNPQLISIFNSAPDETAFYHHWFMRSDLATSIIVIQPDLYQLTGDEVKALSLDAQNVFDAALDSFLVLDSFFSVVIYCCREDLIKLHPSDNSLLIYQGNDKLSVPLQFVSRFRNRVIPPSFVVTQKNHSQARFLLARLNPVESGAESEPQDVPTADQPSGLWGFLKALVPSATNDAPKKYISLMTDDISLAKYYESIITSLESLN